MNLNLTCFISSYDAQLLEFSQILPLRGVTSNERHGDDESGLGGAINKAREGFNPVKLT